MEILLFIGAVVIGFIVLSALKLALIVWVGRGLGLTPAESVEAYLSSKP